MPTITETPTRPMVVRLRPRIALDDDQLMEISRDNRDLRFERTEEGELIVMPPTGGDAGRRNAVLTGQLRTWVQAGGRGVVFDSSTGFSLPRGAVRSPDAAWVRDVIWQALSPEQREGYPPICPDFVVEIRSSSDRIGELQAKMKEYVRNGVKLGWLVDPQERRVHVYRSGAKAQVLEDPKALSGDPLLPGFVLTLAELW